jgi:replicative superfamily II helicase
MNVSKLNIITGETGCGKTYSTIKKLQTSNTSFVYLAPCRQLVYETFIEYSYPEDDLSTGEVKIINKQYGNLFAVYESLKPEQIKNYSALIIDEAHFLCDEDRGAKLNHLLTIAKQQHKVIYLLTATNSLRKKDFPYYKTTRCFYITSIWSVGT